MYLLQNSFAYVILPLQILVSNIWHNYENKKLSLFPIDIETFLQLFYILVFHSLDRAFNSDCIILKSKDKAKNA